MKYLILFSLIISSCNSTGFTDDYSHQTKCVDGVSYIINNGQLSPHYNQDGTIKTCTGE